LRLVTPPTFSWGIFNFSLQPPKSKPARACRALNTIDVEYRGKRADLLMG